MHVRDYFQPPRPTRQEALRAYAIFLEDFGRWYSTKGSARPFDESSPHYVQLGYDVLSIESIRPSLAPGDFGREYPRLRAGVCATAMIDQDMYQLFSWRGPYDAFRNRFVFPKLENNLPSLGFIDEAVLENEDLVLFMKCLYLLVFRWLKDHSRDGIEQADKLYRQLRSDNAVAQGLRGILWTRIFADVPLDAV